MKKKAENLKTYFFQIMSKEKSYISDDARV
jgi:hypothetical protein